MKTQIPNKPKKFHGFALIATILLMVLLAIITVGTLGLSAVTLRSGTQDSALARAQSNARMALMIAIGEIQKELGPDQRISANSAILNPDVSKIPNRHWTGVWNSWKAGDGEYSQHSTIGLTDEIAPSYAPNRNDYFRKWLVSLEDYETSSISSPIDLTLEAKNLPTENDDAILLVGQGTLGESTADESDHIGARLLDIRDSYTSEITGRYGWWVGDESQKARLMDDSYAADSALTRVDKIYRSQSPASTGTKMVRGLENIADDTELAALPSLKTLDLVTGSVGFPSQLNFHDVTHCSTSVLSDVREGGLKRDLSTLLERPISTSETGDEFMLYRFDDKGEHRVPIQDLAAYYQLYYNDPTWSSGRRGGINFNPGSKTFEIKSPDYGDANSRDKYLRQYTSLYTSPVPVRIQFILAMGGTPITAQERTANPAIRPTDTHKLVLGVIPVLTLWNPNNVPLVVERGKGLMFKLTPPPFALAWKKIRGGGGGTVKKGYFNLGYALSSQSGSDGRSTSERPYVMQFKFAESNSVRFEPGEVKIFSFPSTSARTFQSGLDDQTLLAADGEYEPRNSWDPFGVFVCGNSASGLDNTDVFVFTNSQRRFMVFKASDTINVHVAAEGAETIPNNLDTAFGTTGLQVSLRSEVFGAGLNFWMSGINHGKLNNSTKTYHLRNYQCLSKLGIGNNNTPFRQFNRDLMMQGFPQGKSVIPFLPDSEALPGSQIIGATNSNEVASFLVFTLGAACETNSKHVGGYGSGRKTATRPFLHGSTIAAPLIDKTDKSARYDYGWEWQVDRINSIEEAIQMAPGTGNTFYGGGYTMEAGTTHVVQQNLPVLPPISIAALSSAHLGGFSLANQSATAKSNQDITLRIGTAVNLDPLRDPTYPEAFSVVTATGAAGLAPHVMQAIGNSYAHPNLPADQAVSMTYTRQMNHEHPAVQIPYVDHSYLANKALWDEFFFSSMVAQPSVKVPLYEKERSLATVAEEFFFGTSENTSVPLPNRRMIPYCADSQKVNELLTKANQYKDGLADRIAAHLMVEGAFNVNSTSVEAWKVFLSSLRGKPVARLDNAALSEHCADGVTVNGGTLGNATPVKGSQISKFNEPPEQWHGGRELSDAEIEELAKAIVVQVKQRGPFLSLSEFVNRRLENNSPLAVKGALQAALDDPSVSINANFRTTARMLDSETVLANGTPAIPFAHPEAAKGPIAYGSAAYVDQADILGNFAEQLTARGDTFVIRSYGDALDKNGKVIARAWCEALVQRVPEYVNSADDPHLKQADSTLSESSKNFGRKIRIIAFRWLNPSEI